METEGLFSLGDATDTDGARDGSTLHATGSSGRAAPAHSAVRGPRGLRRDRGRRAARRPDAAGRHRRAGRPGPPARARCAAAAAGRQSTTPISVILWGPPGTGKTTIAHLVAGATDRTFVALSALNAGVKDVRAVIDTGRDAAAPGWPADRAVHRRGAPLLQDAAGFAARRGRGPHRHAARGDHREPVLLGDLAAAVPLRAAHPASRSTKTRSAGWSVARSPTSAGWAARSRSPPTRKTIWYGWPRGDVRKALTALEAAAAVGDRAGRHARSTWRPPSGRSTSRRCATTGTATSTTT